MGLNETLDRVARERKAREQTIKEPESVSPTIRDYIIRDYAERIFFTRMLKDINHGMSEPKIEAMIDRSVMIAQKLYTKLQNI